MAKGERVSTTVIEKTADEINVGDLIVTQQGDHLVLRVSHGAEMTRLRTVDMSTGEPKTRRWKHSRRHTVNDCTGYSALNSPSRSA